MEKYIIIAFIVLPGFISASTIDDHQYQLDQISNQFNQYQAQVQAITKTLFSLGPQVAGIAVENCNFTRPLYLGRSGEDVRCLQRYLNVSGFVVAVSGPGSSGQETTYYGQLTRGAVARWQTSQDISPSVGYLGPISQAKYQEILSVVSVQPSQTQVTVPEIVSPTIATPISGGEAAELPSQIDGVVGIEAGLSISSSLIPAGTIVPFVNFVLNPGRPLEIVELVIEHSGTGLLSDFQEVIVTADDAGQPRGSGQTLAIGLFDTTTQLARLPTFSSWTFNTSLNLTVAAVMKKDISDDVTHSLKVRSVKLRDPASSIRYEISGGPIPSANHRTDQTKQVGTVELGGISSTGWFGNLVIKTSSYEHVTIRNITLLETGESVKIGGASYPCRLAHGREFCSFGDGIVLLKNEIKNIVPQSINAQAKKLYDISITGDTSGFRLVPTAPVVLGTSADLYFQIQSDLALMEGQLLKIRSDLALLAAASF